MSREFLVQFIMADWEPFSCGDWPRINGGGEGREKKRRDGELTNFVAYKGEHPACEVFPVRLSSVQFLDG